MQFDLFVVTSCNVFKRVYVYAVIVVHITDTHTSIPVVLTTQIFLFFGGWGGGEDVVRSKVPVHALKT